MPMSAKLDSASAGSHPSTKSAHGWIVGAHRDGKRFIVQANELLTAFLELESAIHQFAVDAMS